MNFNIPLKIDETQILKEAQEKAQKAATEIALGLVRAHFSDGRFNYPVRPGFGYLQIKDRIDAFLTSPEFVAKIDKLVDPHMNAAIEEAVSEACKRGARKVAHLTVEKEIESKTA